MFVEPSMRNMQWALDVLKKNAKKSPYNQNHNMAMCNILVTKAAVCDKGKTCDKTAIYVRLQFLFYRSKLSRLFGTKPDKCHIIVTVKVLKKK